MATGGDKKERLTEAVHGTPAKGAYGTALGRRSNTKSAAQAVLP